MNEKLKRLQGEINDIYMKADRSDQAVRRFESEVQDLRERLFDKAGASDLLNLEDRVTE